LARSRGLYLSCSRTGTDMNKMAKELVTVAKELMAFGGDWNRREWVVHPQQLIDKALRLDLITRKEARSRDLMVEAQMEAEQLNDIYLGSGQGFGSSDMNHSIHSMLRGVRGINVDWVKNRLTRIASE